MKIMRYIKIIVGSLGCGISVYSGLEVLKMCSIVWKILDKTIGGPYGGIMLLLPIGLMMWMMRTPSSVRKNPELENAYNWIISGISIIVGLFYTSLTKQSNPWTGNVLTKSWIRISQKVTTSEKLEWLESIKSVLCLSPERWEKVIRGINLEWIGTYKELTNVIVENLGKLIAEEEGASRWRILKFLDYTTDQIWEHPWIGGVVLGLGLWGIFSIHETLIGKILALVHLLRDSVDAYREYWKVVAQLTADVGKIAEAQVLILQRHEIDHSALLDMLEGLKECITKTEALILIEPLKEEILETKVVLHKIVQAIEKATAHV